MTVKQALIFRISVQLLLSGWSKAEVDARRARMFRMNQQQITDIWRDICKESAA